MGWFTKEKKTDEKNEEGQLPDLPPLPELPKIESDLPPLPHESSGESSRFQPERFSKDIPEIKSSNVKAREISLSKLDKIPQQNFSPIPSELIPMPFKRSSQEISSQLPQNNMAPNFRKEVEPIFVRIDKFEDALKNFNEIKHKISEIESFLKNIREKKEKEDAELYSWEKEVDNIKKRIDTIDRELFSKIS